MAEGRPLTVGEIALARKVYKFSINFAEVKIHDRKLVAFQPWYSGMTPTSKIFVNGLYREDYAVGRADSKSFLIHELAHVYQYQLKILNPVLSAIAQSIKHRFDYNRAYYYRLEGDKDLMDYAMEQQAQILEDYFRVVFLKVEPRDDFLLNTETGARRDGLYKSVLRRFLKDPSYPTRVTVCARPKHGKPQGIVCKRRRAG